MGCGHNQFKVAIMAIAVSEKANNWAQLSVQEELVHVREEFW